MDKGFLSKQQRFEVRRIIEEKTGYQFQSWLLLSQVFRRSSLAAEMGRNSNEIFEFIGDRVLSFYVVKLISQRCGSLSLTRDYAFLIEENEFTKIKQKLVTNEAFSKIIDEWGLAKYLLLSESDVKNEVAKETKVKADLFEAVIGAIAIESQWDSEILETAVTKALDLETRLADMIENDGRFQGLDVNMDNAVTILKELAEKKQCTMPTYEFWGPDALGYDNDGNPKWACSCSVVNSETGIKRGVSATSKKDAKKAAAYLVLCEHLHIPNKYGKTDKFPLWIYENGKLLPDRPSSDKEELS